MGFGGNEDQDGGLIPEKSAHRPSSIDPQPIQVRSAVIARPIGIDFHNPAERATTDKIAEITVFRQGNSGQPSRLSAISFLRPLPRQIGEWPKTPA
jgi:hypothetical protein